MNIWEIIGGVVMIVLSVVIMFLVLRQEGAKGGGMSALAGGDSYYNKNQGRTLDAMLYRGTKIAAVLFFVVTIIVYAIAKLKGGA